MHSHTPSISVIEPRGLAVRALAYYRRAADEPVETRVTHQHHDTAGRLTEQRDPRLLALMRAGDSVPPNLSTFYSLSGQSLCSDSVDAGWQLSLPGAAGQPIESWDQRGWHRRTELDALLRPVAIFEHFPDEPERCTERITLGSSSPDDALHNRCGQPVRHDDTAGSRLLSEYGLTGAVLAEVRHFLEKLDSPDWPAHEVERNPLLEPGDGARSAWHFAATGEALSQTDAKGHIRQFAQDRAGQLREVRLQRAGQPAAETLVSTIEYNALGQVQQEWAGNGMRSFSTYDPADGHLLSLANQGPDGVFLQNLSYRYDPVGNITDIADAALPLQHFANQRIEPLRRFTYDTLYQLIKATGWETAKPSFGPALPEWQAFGPPDASRWRNYSESYHYDEAGNLLERLHLGAENDTLTMRVAAHSNRSIKGRPGADLEALFDARGNMLELQPGQGIRWNGRNELAEVTQVARIDAADDLERYVYDGEGTRLRKTRTATAKSVIHTAEVRYLPGIELHTNSATGEQMQVVGVEAGHCSVRLLHWNSPPPDGVANDQLRYSFDDHLGSSAFEVDAQGKPISQEVYYPYGGTAWLAGRREVETSYKTIRYSGKERDATGLYYYGARYYVPWLQRWLSPDPAGDVDGLNLYRFVQNNSLKFVDVEGFIPVLRAYHDRQFESAIGIRDQIKHRGLGDIAKHSPRLTTSLTEAFGIAKADLKATIDELKKGRINHHRDVAESHFGSFTYEDLNYLIEGYERALLNLTELKNDDSRFVTFAGSGKFSDNEAFSDKRDKYKKIYLNVTRVENFTAQHLAQILVHEITHFNDVFSAKDYWYVNLTDQDLKKVREHYNLAEDEARNKFMLNLSDHFIVGENVEDNDIALNARGAFTAKAGAVDFSKAVAKFRTDAGMRRDMSRKNADTLASFVRSISLSVTKR